MVEALQSDNQSRQEFIAQGDQAAADLAAKIKALEGNPNPAAQEQRDSLVRQAFGGN